MKPNDVYEILTQTLQSCLTDSGFTQTSGWQASIVWTKALDRGFIIFNCQIHKDGYLPPVGTKFYLKGAIGAKPEYKDADMEHRYPASSLFTNEQLLQAHHIQKTVIDKTISQKRLEAVPHAILESQKHALSLEISRPYMPQHEIAYRYLDSSDVLAWSEFFQTVMPTVISALEAKARAAFPALSAADSGSPSAP